MPAKKVSDNIKEVTYSMSIKEAVDIYKKIIPCTESLVTRRDTLGILVGTKNTIIYWATKKYIDRISFVKDLWQALVENNPHDTYILQNFGLNNDSERFFHMFLLSNKTVTMRKKWADVFKHCIDNSECVDEAICYMSGVMSEYPACCIKKFAKHTKKIGWDDKVYKDLELNRQRFLKQCAKTTVELIPGMFLLDYVPCCPSCRKSKSTAKYLDEAYKYLDGRGMLKRKIKKWMKEIKEMRK